MKLIRDFLFPQKLRRLSYFLRLVPLNFTLLAMMKVLDDPNPSNAFPWEIVFGGLILILYGIFFVYLPRVRDCGMSSWTLLLGTLPGISSLYGILLLFKPSKPFFGQKSVAEKAALPLPDIAGNTCSACGARLVLASEGVVTSAGQVLCKACNLAGPSSETSGGGESSSNSR